MAATGMTISGCSDKAPFEWKNHLLQSFTVQVGDAIYHARIDPSTRRAEIGGIEYGSAIEKVAYRLADGAKIAPDPATRLGKWTGEERFTVTASDRTSVVYTVVLTAFKAVEPGGEEPEPGHVILNDDFEQESRIPDPAIWTVCAKGGSNWNKHMSGSYDQTYVDDGKLVLVAELVNGEYRAGGVETMNKLEFTYGKVEVCARFTKTVQGGWPAIWLMSTVNRAPEGAPSRTAGEIDIMEQLNHDLFVYQTVHNHYKNDLGITDPAPVAEPAYGENAFNVYGVIWTPEAVTFTANGRETLSYPNLHLPDEETKVQFPYHDPFYLILNYALGGPGTWPGEISDPELPAKMEIDWVKITKID